MVIKGRTADERYLLKVLAWFYGMDVEVVKTIAWGMDEIGWARDFCEATNADV